MNRILQNFGYSFATLCHTESTNYFPRYLQRGHTIPCKISWPCED